MQSEIHDIAILGGGTVGATLALVLAAEGLRTVLIDRVPAGTRAAAGFDGRAYAIALGSQRVLAHAGVWPAIAARAQPIRDIRVGEGAGSPSLIHFDPAASETGAVGWIVEDHDLRSALAGRILDTHLPQVAPAGLVSATFGPGPGVLRLDDGEEIRARLLVAADGRRSALARAAGIGRVGWSYRQTGLVAAIAHEADHEGLAHQSFFPGGPFAVLPMTGRRSSIVWSEREAVAERVMRVPDAAYADMLRDRIGDRLGEVRLIGRRWAYPLSLGLADAYAGPRLVLVGDAAHGVHPIAGQGMNLGLRDVAALAEVVVEAARRGEDIGAAQVTERYSRWRRFDATVTALGMDALNRLFSNAVPVLSTLRRVGMAGVGRLPGATGALMREATGQAGEVPRLLRGEAL